MPEASVKKSQLIVFSETGKIISSCNTLFNVSRMAGKNVFEVYPVLKCLKEIIERQEPSGNPLFLPHIAFATYQYRSICDFIFVKKEIKSGILISWMINDNSLHYKSVLSTPSVSRKKNYGSYFMIENNSAPNKNFIR